MARTPFRLYSNMRADEAQMRVIPKSLVGAHRAIMAMLEPDSPGTTRSLKRDAAFGKHSDGETPADNEQRQLAQLWLFARPPLVPRVPPRPSFSYPDDPHAPPGPGWEWRGRGTPQDGTGKWFNRETGESYRFDPGHEGKGPHLDYSPERGHGGRGRGWRWFPDGSWEPKEILAPFYRDEELRA
jgi:hypothetical protein